MEGIQISLHKTAIGAQRDQWLVCDFVGKEERYMLTHSRRKFRHQLLHPLFNTPVVPEYAYERQ